MSQDLVVDASVAIKLFVEEELSAEAEQLFAKLTEPMAPRFFVPDLFYQECANILWKYVRRYGLDPEQARRNIIALRALPLSGMAVGNLAEPCLDLALEWGVTAYDACYAVLAQSLGVPFVTADRKLIERLAGSGIEIRGLDDLNLGV